MKTKEFIEHINTLDFKTQLNSLWEVKVLSNEDETILYGDTDVNIQGSYIMEHPQHTSKVLVALGLMYTYLKTPEDKRKDSKVKIHVTGKKEDGISVAVEDSRNSFVNHYTDDDTWRLDTESNLPDFNIYTIFDKSEVKEIMDSHFRAYTYVIEPVES